EVSGSHAQLKQSEDECEDDRGGDRAPGHGQEQRDDLQAEQPDIVQSRTPARQVERMRNDAQEQEVPELAAIGEEAAEIELIARTRAQKLRDVLGVPHRIDDNGGQSPTTASRQDPAQ